MPLIVLAKLGNIRMEPLAQDVMLHVALAMEELLISAIHVMKGIIFRLLVVQHAQSQIVHIVIARLVLCVRVDIH